MKSVKSMLCRVIIASAFVSTAAGAVSLQDLSSAATQLTGGNSTTPKRRFLTLVLNQPA